EAVPPPWRLDRARAGQYVLRGAHPAAQPGTHPGQAGRAVSAVLISLPFVPAKAGTQSQTFWIPAFAGMSGERVNLQFPYLPCAALRRMRPAALGPVRYLPAHAARAPKAVHNPADGRPLAQSDRWSSAAPTRHWRART